MKAADVVKALRFNLPFYTDLFTDNIAVTSITSFELLATVVTSAPHGLLTNSYAHISGALVPNSIISLTQVDGVALAETAVNHDLTKGYQQNVEIIGTTETEYNGTHELLSVPDRTHFTFVVDSGAPSPATGSPLLLEDLKRFTYNGWHKITKINDTTFTYPLEKAIGSPAYGNISLQIKPRITGELDLDRAKNSYTEQSFNKLWAYVVLDNIVANKDRSEETDATYTAGNHTAYRQLIIQNFHVYVFVPATSSTSGAFARDQQDDILIALNKALLRLKFEQPGFEEPYVGAVFIGSDFGIDSNSFYIHDFIYETTGNLVYEDTIDEDKSVAFRDVYEDFKSSLSDDDLVKMQAIVNLDNDV